MFNQSVIEELKMRNNIDDVISSYVHLQRSGQNLKGLCPFHSEKTPSFTVNPSEGFFYCFGCGAGGDVITFIMKAENLAYPEALEFLAKRTGMTLPSDFGGEKKDDQMSRSEVMTMNRHAAKYFYEALMNPRTPEGLDYLRGKRGFSLSLIRHFGMGYAPSYGLRNYMHDRGYTDKQLEEGYLVRYHRDSGQYYEIFRNRVIVPILDAGGNVIAFGGRILDDKQPKYLNTSDTAAFKKSRNLFALNFAKDFCAERMILCEGYMDAIALHGVGFKNAIATLGTAMTSEHARLMKRYTKCVVICYDADAAGQNAADKAFRLLSEVGLEARILKVVGAKDPDEFIKKSGADAFAKLLDGSKTRFEFKFEQILEKYDISKMDERIRAAEDTTALITMFPSSVERELYINAASDKLGVTAETLKDDIDRRLRQQSYRRKSEHSNEILRRAEGYEDRINSQTVGNVAAVRSEEAILGLIMHRRENAERAIAEKLVTEQDFITAFNKKVFIALRELIKNGDPPDPSLFAENFTPDEMGRITKMWIDRTTLADNGYAVLTDCVKKLRDCKKAEDTTDDILEILKKKRKGR